MWRFLKKFACEKKGSALVEFAVGAGLLILLTMGAVDFSLAFYQWNRASKAVQLGARLAAVSDPICGDLLVEDGEIETGADEKHSGELDPPDYVITFTGPNGLVAASCTCAGTSDNSCTAKPADKFKLAAVNNLIFGRGSSDCLGGDPFPGMCDIFPQITAQNIIVRYRGTDLGYVLRPLGPVPTITVEITGLNFNFMLLNFLGLGPIPMPRMHTTVTGEDLSTTSS